jgi:hypothetical protein
LADKKWAKVLLLAVSAFTFGSALMAGAKGFMAAGAKPGATFMTKFVQGGKDFVSSLMGQGAEGAANAGQGPTVENALTQGANQSSLNPMAMNQGVEAGLGTMNTAGASNVNAAGDLVSGGGGNLTAAKAAGANVGQGPTMAAATQGMSKGVPEGNWLSKAASKAWDFATSENGQNIIGSALEGQYAGARDEEWMKHQSRYDRMWADPKNAGNVAMDNMNYNMELPQNWPGSDQSQVVNERNRGYVPTVAYRDAVEQGGG